MILQFNFRSFLLKRDERISNYVWKFQQRRKNKNLVMEYSFRVSTVKRFEKHKLLKEIFVHFAVFCPTCWAFFRHAGAGSWNWTKLFLYLVEFLSSVPQKFLESNGKIKSLVNNFISFCDWSEAVPPSTARFLRLGIAKMSWREF